MKVLRIVVLSAGLLVCFGACVGTARPRCESAFRNVETVLDVYEKEHPVEIYPRTLSDLQRFAAKKGKPLNLAPFSEFTYKRSRKGCTISYTCLDTGLAAAHGRTRVTIY